MLERHLAAILVAGHDHAGHPEENDVRTGHQVRRGIIIIDLGVVGVEYAVEQRDRPQPGREPCVEAVALLLEVAGRDGWVLLLSQLQCLFGGFGYHKVALAVGSGEVVSRYAVAPP